MNLKRIRWGVRVTLLLGVAASVTANVLHARDNPISQAIAAWPPLALLLTVELISRVPVHRRSLGLARFFATTTIATIAAWVSYWHMAGVASRYGETGASPYLLPLSVDGLIIVASICLVELSGRICADVTSPAANVVPAVGDRPAPSLYAEPIGPRPAPKVPDDVKPDVRKTPPKSLTAAQRVARAAKRNPHATATEIAVKASVSEPTARRHLRQLADAVPAVAVTSSPAVAVTSSSDPVPAETQPERINGFDVLEEVKQ